MQIIIIGTHCGLFDDIKCRHKTVFQTFSYCASHEQRSCTRNVNYIRQSLVHYRTAESITKRKSDRGKSPNRLNA